MPQPSASALASATMPCPQPSVRWTARLYRNPMSSTFRILPTRCTTGSGMKPTSRPSPFYRRRPSFTGALVREAGHPLVEALCATAGQSAGTLLAARLLDTAAFWAQLAHRSAESACPSRGLHDAASRHLRGDCLRDDRPRSSHTPRASGSRGPDSSTSMPWFPHRVAVRPPRVPASRRLKAP